MKSRILSRPGGAPIPWRQRGFGLIELIIAVFIGLFLLGGLAVVLQMTSNIFGSQTGLSLLQDEERLGMNLLTNVIEHAGYFPAPVPNPGNQQAMNISRANAFPASSVQLTSSYAATLSAGQYLAGCNASITGCSPAVSGTDILAVVYVASASNASYGDNIESCNGDTNSSSNPVTYANIISVQNNVDGTSSLACQVNSNTVQPLVTGVTGLSVVWGVDNQGDGSVHAYIPTANMSAANWLQVLSVQPTLSFTNPLASTPCTPPGTPQPCTISFTRTINLLNLS